MCWNWRSAICINWGNVKPSDWALLHHRPHLRKTNSALDSLTAPLKCLAISPPPPAWTSQSASDSSPTWDVASINWKRFRLPEPPSLRPVTRRPARLPNSSNLNCAASTVRPSCLPFQSVRLFLTSWTRRALAIIPNTRSAPICIHHRWPRRLRKFGGLGRRPTLCRWFAKWNQHPIVVIHFLVCSPLLFW